MVGLIPEKTVEVWTACSLLAILGQRTRIWSPAASYDQGVWLDEWADVLVKWFVLELKAPKCGHGPIGQNTLHDCRTRTSTSIYRSSRPTSRGFAGVHRHIQRYSMCCQTLLGARSQGMEPFCLTPRTPTIGRPSRVVVRHPGDTT